MSLIRRREHTPFKNDQNKWRLSHLLSCMAAFAICTCFLVQFKWTFVHGGLHISDNSDDKNDNKNDDYRPKYFGDESTKVEEREKPEVGNPTNILILVLRLFCAFLCN